MESWPGSSPPRPRRSNGSSAASPSSSDVSAELGELGLAFVTRSGGRAETTGRGEEAALAGCSIAEAAPGQTTRFEGDDA